MTTQEIQNLAAADAALLNFERERRLELLRRDVMLRTWPTERQRSAEAIRVAAEALYDEEQRIIQGSE